MSNYWIDLEEIAPTEVVTTDRKLKAVWSSEAQEDLRAWHRLRLEDELAAILAEEINREIDREIMADFRSCSGNNLGEI